MREFVRPRIVSSKCLEFEACRYDGERVSDPLVRKLMPLADFSPVCAEMEIGLGVPRDPIRVVSTKPGLRLLQPSSGMDCTERMTSFARAFLDSLQEVDGFILKSRSPSCGLNDAKIRSEGEEAQVLGEGAGFFGGEVLKRHPLLPVEDEERLGDLRIREHFLTGIFTLAAFRRPVSSGAMRDLVSFHSDNGLLLTAYDQPTRKAMDNLVANRDERPAAQVLAGYRELLLQALAKPPRPPSAIGVLLHALGFFEKGPSARERAWFLEQLGLYRSGKAPLGAPVGVMGSWIVRYGQDRLARQTLFCPYPAELLEITGSG